MVMLTLDCIDYTVAIFNQLFEKFACPLQLHFITLESLPEVRTVQIAIAKLQRRVPHLLNNWGGVYTTETVDVLSRATQPTLDYRTLPIAAQLGRLHTLICPEESTVSAGGCGCPPVLTCGGGRNTRLRSASLFLAVQTVIQLVPAPLCYFFLVAGS